MGLTQAECDRFADEYRKVCDLAASADGATAIREGGRVFEELCKAVLTAYLPRVDFSVRKDVFEKEGQIGKGTKGIADFTFGQVVGLFRETSFAKAIEAVEQKSAAALGSVNLDYIATARNEAVHKGASYEPAEYDVEYVISSLRVFLLYFDIEAAGPKAKSAPKTISELSGVLQEAFSSVEVLEGTQSFYRRLIELLNRPEIDTLDFTYLVETPPMMSRTAGRDARTEYFRLAREKILSGNARLRRIVTFSNESKAAWILFSLVGAHHEVFDTDIRLAYFDAKKSNGSSSIMIPNLTLFYSSQDVSDGVAWIYSLQEEDNQNFVGLSGKAVFSTMRRLYANWFRSCDMLTESRALDAYRQFFGTPSSIEEVRALAERYCQATGLDEEANKKAVRYWGRMHGLDNG